MGAMLDLFKCLFFEFYLYLVGVLHIMKQILNPHWPLFLPNQNGKVVVITGGSRGIGREAVRKLLALQCRVIIGCRDVEQAQESFTNEEKKNLKIISLDLMDMGSVREFADKVKDLNLPIYALINNAGIMFGERKVTKDGFESQLATNYLGHFLLTHLLLPIIRKNKNRPGRIVNVSSCAHYCGTCIDFEDLNLTKFYSPIKSYGNSKAAQVMFSQFLDSKLSGTQPTVRVLAIHPGIILTDLWSNVRWVQIFTFFAKLIMRTPKQGGDTIVYAALEPDLNEKETTGLYLEYKRLRRITLFTAELEHQSKLWDKTCEMLGIENFGDLNL